MKEANTKTEICPNFVQWLLNVFKAKFYRVSQKSHTIYAIGIVVGYCTYYANVIPKRVQYDQLCPSSDPELSINGISTIVCVI